MLRSINALKRLNKLMTCINEELEPKLKERIHPLLGPSLVNLGKAWGGEQPNVVPGDAHLQVERRYIPGETLESVKAELDEAVKKCNEGYEEEYAITYESMPYSLKVSKTPMDIPEGHPIVQGMKKAGMEVLGKEPEIDRNLGFPLPVFLLRLFTGQLKNNNFIKSLFDLVLHWASMCRTRTATVRAVTTRRPVSQKRKRGEPVWQKASIRNG